MSESEPLENYQQIERAQKFSDLLPIYAGIKESSYLLLEEFEEKILDKVLELLSDQKEQHWCSHDEFAFLINGLNSKLSAKYQEALILATNMGMSDFQIFDHTLDKFFQEHKDKIEYFNQGTDAVSPLLKDTATQSRINGIRGAINQEEFDPKNETDKKRKRKGTPEQAIPKIDDLPFKKIISNLYRLSSEILKCKDREKQLIILETFEDLGYDKIENSYNLFDALSFTRLHHPDYKMRCQAQYVLETFDALSAYVAVDSRGKYDENGKLTITHVSSRRKERQAQMRVNLKKSKAKEIILRKVFECPPISLADDRIFNKNVRSAGLDSFAKMTGSEQNLTAFCEKSDNFTHDPLANKLIEFIMEEELLLIKKEGNFGGFVLPSKTVNNQENILLTWRGNITLDNLDELDPSSLAEFRTNLPHLLNLSNKPLEVTEVAAVLAFLRPELNLNETTPLTELKDQARGGMFPVSKRGISVNLDQSQGQDKLLFQVGLKQLTFKRTVSPHNLQVSLQLGKRVFTFGINEQMEAPALSKLAPTEKAWIERVVFSYLLAIKNRDLYQTSTIAAKPIAENRTTEIEQMEDYQRKEVTNSSHLYVLPYSYQPKDWDDPSSSINSEVEEEFGYSLLKLNKHFYLAQQDLKYLDTLEDKTLKRIILSSLKRLEGKINPGNWDESRVKTIKTQIRETMLGIENTVSPMNEKDNSSENIALIGFKHEPIDPSGPPLQIKLSEVSDQLFNQIS